MEKVRCVGRCPEHIQIAYSRITAKLNKKLTGTVAPKGEAYVLSSRATERNTDRSKKNACQKSRVANAYIYGTRNTLTIETMCQFLPRLKAVIDMSYTGGNDDSDDSSDESDSDDEGSEGDENGT